MREIELTQGKVALIDDEDWPLVSQHTWHAAKSSDLWYARTTKRKTRMRVFMHRLIMNPPRGLDVDHINGDGLDNRKQNLRQATDSQNQQNRHRLSTNTSGYRGVTFHKKLNKWQAGIKKFGHSYYLGLHPTAESAALAYDLKAREIYGEGARLNFPILAA